jgi:hypothetical protein
MRTFSGINLIRQMMALGFAAIFLVLAVTLAGMTVIAMVNGLTGETNLTEAFLKAINMAVVSLATFELGLVVNKEYAGRDDEGHISTVLRRTLPRFVSIVCIALVLEGLLMVIKYSQLELAGNLYYPVAVICSAALLLAALGVFLRLSGAQPVLVDAESTGAAPATEPPQQGHPSEPELAHRLA